MRQVKDSILYIVGEVTSKVFPFLLLPYLTNKLGVESYGQLTIALSIITIMAIIFCSGQDAALPKIFFSKGRRSASVCLYSGVILTIIISLALLTAVLSLGEQGLIPLLYCAMSQVILGQCLILFQCKKESVNYIVWNLAFNFLSISLTILFFEFLESSYEKRILAIGVANTVIASFLLFIHSKKRNVLTLSRFKIMVSFVFLYGWPIIIQNFSIYAKGQFDRLFLSGMFSNSDLGVYAAAFQLATIVTVIYMAINRALLPYYYEAIKAGAINKANIRKIYLVLFLIPIPVFIIMNLIPKMLFGVILGAGFEDAKLYFVLFSTAISINFSYLVVSNYLLYFSKTKILSSCNVASAILHIPLLYFLSEFGLKMVPYALIASNLLLSLSTYICFERMSNAKRT